MSEPGEDDLLPLNRIDAPVLAHAQTPRIGDVGQPPDVALGSPALRILYQVFEGASEPLLDLAGEGLELLLRTGCKGDRERSQGTASKIQFFSNLVPGTPLLPS